ncbi:MAG TPA: polysaccharide pyruvyl transferase family protein [Flavobacteriales bacterium]|nr:polysaccharide pyruvyl transferase family protein [Flavobacteriales bacterium]
MSQYYVILTGSKNNAGDYLIKYRAKKLFSELRPDRSIIDYDAWLPFTPEQLDIVNNSKALILMGGPSLKQNMRSVYPMVTRLDEIKVPIITMGVGWKSLVGDWNETYKYTFDQPTLALLERVNESGYISSVRDFHSLNALLKDGFKNFAMTGCPALYETNYIGKPCLIPGQINTISYSLGVSFVDSPGMENAMKENVLSLSNLFKDKKFQVVFHHSLNKGLYDKSESDALFHKKHQELSRWLEQHNIAFTEISGSAENLINHYTNCDLHIGYRVHAHIFMSSISKPSVLLCEDGRGTALANVISGLIFNTYNFKNENLKLADATNKPGIKAMNKLYASFVNVNARGYKIESLPWQNKELLNHLDYEIKTGFNRLNLTRASIDVHFEQMKKFLKQLP